MKKTLNIALIGTGFIGKQHLEAIMRIPYTKIVAVADCNEAGLKSTAEAFGIEKTYTDYREMLEKEDIDVVHNCTPSAMHYQINKDIIKSGKHVYCEKPLTLTSEESKELVELAKEYGVATGANFNYRNNAMVREMRERIQNGEVGRPLLVHGSYLQDWLMFDTDYDWRMDPKLGGNSRALSDIGSHCFDTIQFVLGDRITEVNANAIIIYPERKKTEGGGTFSASSGKVTDTYKVCNEDAAFVMARFESGIQGFFNISQVCGGKKNGLEVNVSGSKESLEWHQEQSDRLFIGKRETGNEELFVGAAYLTGEVKRFATLPNGHPVGWADAFRNGILSYYESIWDESYKSGFKWYADFESAHYIMKIIEACLESSKVGTWVKVER